MWISNNRRECFVRYGLAIAAVAAAALLTMSLRSIVDAHLPLAWFYPAVAWCAWRLGVGPTLLAVALSIVSVDLMLLPRQTYLAFAHAQANIQLATFGFASTAMLLMSLRAERARDQARRSEQVRHQAEQSLRSIEAMHRARGNELDTLMEMLPTPVVIAHDAACEHVTGNNATYALLRLSPGENISLPSTDPTYEVWVDGRRATADELPLRRAARLAVPVSGKQLELRFADGETRWVYGSAVPLFDEAGAVRGCMGTFVDITDRVVAEDMLRLSEERIRATLKHAPISIAQQDRDLRYTWAHNTQNFSSAEILGRTDFDILDHDVAEELTRLKRAVLTSGVASRHSMMLTIKGDRRAYDLLIEPMRAMNGEVVGITVAAVDVTQQRAISEQLVTLQATLEQRVAERTAMAEQQAQQLRLLASQLTQAEQRERRELAHTLHDHLQQILVAAKLNLGALRSRSREESVRSTVQRVDELLHQSLHVSRSLSAQLCPPILYEGGLTPALKWLARSMREMHGLVVDVSLDLDAEPEREDIRTALYQAVRELLLNVVRHANVSSASLVMNRSASGQVLVVVEDEGCGFDPAEANQPVGEGVGLFGIQHRLDLLGIELKVTSQPGRGTRVALVVPSGTSRPPTVAAGRAGVRLPMPRRTAART